MTTTLPLIPDGACDTHMHVFGSPQAFPLNAVRAYDPPPASVDDYRRLAGRLGLRRAVVVQPSPYGMDNACTLAAVAALGSSARAVVVVDPDLTDPELHRLDAAGARAIRFNLVQASERAALDDLDRLARRIEPLGWHLQVYARPDRLQALGQQLLQLPVDLVIDHIGQPDPAQGIDQPGFATLRQLVDRGRCWVKLSGAYRVDPEGPPWAGAEPFARALLRQAPERMLWATDWPHVDLPRPRSGEPAALPDAARLLARLWEWCDGDEGRFRQVLVDNPAHRYGFAPTD